MKVKFTSGVASHEFTGLGTITTNEWVEVTEAQVKAFEKATGKKLEEAGFEVQRPTKKKEDD